MKTANESLTVQNKNYFDELTASNNRIQELEHKNE